MERQVYSSMYIAISRKHTRVSKRESIEQQTLPYFLFATKLNHFYLLTKLLLWKFIEYFLRL